MLIFVQEINDELVEKQIYAIEEIVPYFNNIQEKFSLTWIKENMGIQTKNIPEKICDDRKTQWNYNNSI